MSSRRRLWLGMAAVGVLAGAAGYAVSLWVREGPDRNAVNPAAVHALMTSPLPDLEGRKQALAGWQGRVMVVNFWATWCAPCREEIPEFVRMQQRYGTQGLQIVGVAIDMPEQVSGFVREFGINYPVLIGGLDTLALMREAGNRLGVLPFSLVVDRQGNIVRRHAGRLTEAELSAILQSLF